MFSELPQFGIDYIFVMVVLVYTAAVYHLMFIACIFYPARSNVSIRPGVDAPCIDIGANDQGSPGVFCPSVHNYHITSTFQVGNLVAFVHIRLLTAYNPSLWFIDWSGSPRSILGAGIIPCLP